MKETDHNTNKQTDKVRKWSRVGTFIIIAVMVLGWVCLINRWFLIPPFFKLSIPLYLFAWLVVLILLVSFTPARKEFLGIFVLGLLIVTPLTMLAFAPALHPFVFISTERCQLLPVSESRIYACDTTGYWTSNEITLFIGPRFSPFMKLREGGFPNGFDLSGANLAGKQLENFNFSNVQLTGADLSGANLNNVNLSDSDLRNANLRGAELSGTFAASANLNGADLRGVNLMNATLWRSDLSGANLEGADLSSTDLTDTNFNEATLLDTKFEAAVLANTNFEDAELDPAALDPADTITNVVLPNGTILTR